MTAGGVISRWCPSQLQGDEYAVFLVQRACPHCGSEWRDVERVSMSHPGGWVRAMIDRDSAAASEHRREVWCPWRQRGA